MVKLAAIVGTFCQVAPMAVTLAAAIGMPRDATGMHVKTLVYDCHNRSTVTVRVSSASAEVLSAGEPPIVLPRVDSSPVRYGDGTTSLSGLDEYIRIEGPRGNLVCRSAPAEVPWEDARLRGIEFRAAGEPDWTLEIDDGARIEFVADRGTTRIVGVPAHGRTSVGQMTVNTASDGHILQILIERRTCATSAGTTTQSATVTLDGVVYTGCGRTLLSGSVTGNVALSTPASVADGSELVVQIVPLGGSSDVLAETRIPIHGKGPFAFHVSYDRIRVFGDDRYVVRAAIAVGSRRQWATRSTPFVVTWGHVSRADLVVEGVPR